MAITVLVVDDQPIYRNVLSMLVKTDPRLRLFGLAGNGQEAVDAVRDACPDAIVLDVRMPVMDGLAALPALREACADSVIVLYSSDPQSTGTALRLGATAVLDKATNATELLDRLVELCEPPPACAG
jgi:two-component system chemotaxis response regulator CheB